MQRRVLETVHCNYRNLREAVFLRRLNRFVAEVAVGSDQVLAHVPSSGRMAELLVPGAQAWVTSHRKGVHKTACRLVLVAYQGILVSVDATLPNRLVNRALRARALQPFHHYDLVRPEYTWDHSRFDFHLSGSSGECLLEVKSVTLVENGVALFPDAPTLRGTRHLEELGAARKAGLQAAVLFVVQRGDACSFSPHRRQDPAFAAALSLAAKQGVRVLAYRCRVSLAAVTLDAEIPVDIALHPVHQHRP